MIHFTYPWAFFLCIPLLVAYIVWARYGHARWWRLLLLILLIAALSAPQIKQGRGGSDVVLILDRSQSMDMHYEEQERIVNLIAQQRGENDRLSIVAVGAGSEIIQGPQNQGLARLADSDVETYASDLRSGVEQAAALVPPERSARIFIHSDGAYTNRNPSILGPQLQARQIPVDVYLTKQNADPDAAVMDIELPSDIRLGESFIGAVRFWSDRQEQRSYTISRDNEIISQGTVSLRARQETVINFADRPHSAGVGSYSVHLEHKNDRSIGNNKARAVLRIDGGERVLVMSADGKPGNVHKALQAAGLNVTSIPEGSINIEQLSAYKVLILDQVPAMKLGHDSMQGIKTWVSKLGGGLLMLGGRRSFGAGGYHLSAVEDVLPVSMELRDEHRKLSVAMAITLDRSGSMSAPVAGGLTKMDLANQGTIAAIDLLGPMDAVAVHAVDSAPHVIVKMSSLANKDAIVNKVRRIASQGGGIYVYEALVGAGRELLGVTQQSARHLILFADAADAENPAQYKQLLKDYRQAGITVSVIGLGSDKDSDADFLKDVAKRGGGRVHFTSVPKDIPRLFAQETVLVARSSWIDQKTPLLGQANLALLVGNNPILNKTWPTTSGYNLCYLKPNAQQYAECNGDPVAPAIAAWHIGNGRSVAIPLAVDDPRNKDFINWDGYAPLLASLVRWCAVSNAQELGLLRAQRFGDSLLVQLELDPEQREKWPSTIPDLELVSANTSLPDISTALHAVDDGRYEAHIHLQRDHVFIPALNLNKQALLGPAMCLPYSPEDKPQLIDHSMDLKKLAKVSKGRVRQDVIDVFDNPPSPGASVDLSYLLVLISLVLLLIEIAVRRLQLHIFKRKAVTTTDQGKPTKETQLSPLDTTKSAASEKHTAGGLDRDTGLSEALRQLRKKR